jgi:Uma2 family endonuclease
MMIPHQEVPRYNYTDYASWLGDWELIHGYPYAMSPSARIRHQLVSGNLFSHFKFALQEKKSICSCSILYETDWIISDDTVVRPDICMVCGNIDPDDFIRTAPVLIAELASKSTRLKDRNTKFALYQQAGVKYYLLVDPDKKQIDYFLLINQQYQQQSPITVFELYERCCTLPVSLQDIFE